MRAIVYPGPAVPAAGVLITFFNSLIEALGAANQPAQAMEVFQMIRQPDGITYNILIRALQKANQPEQAMVVLREMWHRGLDLDGAVDYVSLINAAFDDARRLEMIREIQEHGLAYSPHRQ